MKLATLSVLVLFAVVVFAALGEPVQKQPAHSGTAKAGAGDETARVVAVLDDFHDAASKADGKRYFAHFAAGGVFLGTDAKERWTVDEFRAYAKPYFDQGKGWTYAARAGRRFVSIAKDGRTAWFDEILDNAKYGECRGSGVLVKDEGAWKIAQYHLTVPVPNELMDEVAEKIRNRQ
jgi:hypothetical protein